MSVELNAGRPVNLASLRAGAALALVLAAAAGSLPAAAQSGPDADTVSLASEADEQQRTAEGQSDNATERVYVLGRRVGSSMATMPDPQDAPMIVNVISAETMAEQGVTSLEQALRNVPGITTQIGEGGVMSGDQFFIRGLSAKNDIFTDGLRDFGVYTRDSFNYGQVEVFKGPSGAAFGRGAAGGGINTSSKTPFLVTAGSASVAAGDAEYLRATGDWNQVLGDGVAVRIAAMVHHNENTGRDHVYSDRWGVAPSIGFGLDGDTTATIAYLHQDEEKVPDYGIPTATGADGIGRPVTEFGVDPTNYYGFNTDIDETTVDTVTARLRHVVNDWLTLTSDLKYGYYQRYSQFTPVTCAAPSTTNPNTCSALLTDGNPATIPLGSVGGPGPFDQDTNGVQSLSTAQITAPLFGLRSEMIVGLDASWQQNDRNGYGAYVSRTTTKDLFNPVLGVDPVRGSISNIRDTTAKDVAIFVTDRLWFNDQWSVSAGLRQQWYEVDQETTTFATTGTTFVVASSNSEFLTPQAALIWEPSESQNYYISYSSSAKPPGVSVGNGDTISAPTTPGAIGTQDLEPEENTNIEAGGRISFWGDRLMLQGAVFQSKKDNAKETDPLGNTVRSGDSQEVTGIELGVAGMITEQWSVNANYTFLDTETTDSATATNIGNQVAFTPENAGSLWTTYNFTGGLAGLEIGGGLTYQSEVFLNVQNTAIAPSYTTLDGLISYGWDRFRLSLNGYNLTDELYFAQVHGNRVTPGQGRTFIATLGMVY